eukprot:COSAG06_NODE_745_length_12649_cov_128.650916_2_plen_180_part_00
MADLGKPVLANQHFHKTTTEKRPTVSFCWVKYRSLHTTIRARGLSDAQKSSPLLLLFADPSLSWYNRPAFMFDKESTIGRAFRKSRFSLSHQCSHQWQQQLLALAAHSGARTAPVRSSPLRTAQKRHHPRQLMHHYESMNLIAAASYYAFPINRSINRSIFIGNLRLFWIYFYRLMGNA